MRDFVIAGHGNLDKVKAMLGRRDEVRAILAADPGSARRFSAHFIPVLPHAALSGDLDIVKDLYAGGATEGAAIALSFAVARGRGFGEIEAMLDQTGRPDQTLLT